MYHARGAVSDRRMSHIYFFQNWSLQTNKLAGAQTALRLPAIDLSTFQEPEYFITSPLFTLFLLSPFPAYLLLIGFYQGLCCNPAAVSSLADFTNTVAPSENLCSALSRTGRLRDAHKRPYMFFGSAFHDVCSADSKYDPGFVAECLARVIMSLLPRPAGTVRKLFATETTAFLCLTSLPSPLFLIAISHCSLLLLVFPILRPALLTPVSSRVRVYSPASLSLSQLSWAPCPVHRQSLATMARKTTS